MRQIFSSVNFRNVNISFDHKFGTICHRIFQLINRKKKILPLLVRSNEEINCLNNFFPLMQYSKSNFNGAGSSEKNHSIFFYVIFQALFVFISLLQRRMHKCIFPRGVYLIFFNNPGSNGVFICHFLSRFLSVSGVQIYVSEVSLWIMLTRTPVSPLNYSISLISLIPRSLRASDTRQSCGLYSSSCKICQAREKKQQKIIPTNLHSGSETCLRHFFPTQELFQLKIFSLPRN